jgi:hypothetical protein
MSQTEKILLSGIAKSVSVLHSFLHSFERARSSVEPASRFFIASLHGLGRTIGRSR